MSSWVSAGRCPVGQFGSSASSGVAALAGDLDRLDVGDQGLHLLGIERSATFEPPRRHRRSWSPVGDDVGDFFRREAVQHGVQRRRRPRHCPHLTGGRIGDRERGVASGCVHPTVASGAVEPAVGGRFEQLSTPPGQLAVRRFPRPGLAARFQHPVQRQPDDDDDEQQHTDELDQLEAPPFELLVVVVRPAVGRQLDLRAELLARRPGIEHCIEQPPDEQDDDDQPSNRRSSECDHAADLRHRDTSVGAFFVGGAGGRGSCRSPPPAGRSGSAGRPAERFSGAAAGRTESSSEWSE